MRRRRTGERVYRAGEALAYSPPLRGTRACAIDERGDWHGVPVRDDEELRPVGAAAAGAA